MRTMSACCLRDSLKLSEVMGGEGRSWFIVRVDGAEGNIAGAGLLWRNCGIAACSVEDGGKKDCADRWILLSTASLPWPRCIRINRPTDHLNQLSHARRGESASLAFKQRLLFENLNEVCLQV